MTLRLATRQSPLALIQARLVQRRFESIGIASELVLLETKGDQDTTSDLTTFAGEGVFAVEIQRAVLRGDADVAVHSAKDLPSSSPNGLDLVCVPDRQDPADVLVGRSLAGLGPGATVATGSPRRRALLLERRPDLTIVPLRGNMAKRLATPGTDGVDAVVAAMAALERLHEADLVSERLDPLWFTPQVGQGALALEARSDDGETISLLQQIDDVSAHAELSAERAFLRELGAGCSIPAGANAVYFAGELIVRGVMLSQDGATSVRGEQSGSDGESLGRALAQLLRDELGGGTLPGWDS